MSDKRTAILYSGSAYNIKHSLKSQLENFIIPNDADVFIFTNRFCKRRKTPAGYIPDVTKLDTVEENDRWVEKVKGQFFEDIPLTDEEIQLIKDTLGDRVKVFQVADDFPEYMNYIQDGRIAMMNSINNRMKENEEMGLPKPFNGTPIENPDNGNIRNTSDQYRHVKRCYELMCQYENENNIKYDYVIRARIDFVVPFVFNIAHYYLNHDAPYFYNCSGFRNDDSVEWAEEFCWFSKRSVAEKLFPQLDRIGTINTREYKTIDERYPTEMLFSPEVQYCLLLLELNLHVITIPIHRSAMYTPGNDGFDYFNYMFRRDTISLEGEYKLVCECQTDINEHLPVLRKYAEQCEHIIELGLRYGNSTVAFLAARPKKLISYDMQYNDKMDYLKMIAAENDIDFEIRIEDATPEDDRESTVGETDLLLIDTNHHERQCKAELKMHAHKVRKFIIFHDVQTFGFGMTGGQGGEGGLWLAIDPFLLAHPEWQIVENLTNNNGLLVISRV